MRPLVAVPAYPVPPGRVEGWRDAGMAVPAPYVDALKRAGAQEAVLMPEPITVADAHELLGRFDALLLLGGGDIAPHLYGRARDERTYGVSEVRDQFELALAAAAVDLGLPTLGVCRGMQVLGVACGAKLEQHITDRRGVRGHGVPGIEGGAERHLVTAVPGSRVAQAMGAPGGEVSCHHHQALEAAPMGWQVTASAEDGIIEAIEPTGDAWIVGVQWHPEDTAAEDPLQQRLFDTFVGAAGRS